MKVKPAGLHGFAFERVETKSKKRIWLYGQKILRIRHSDRKRKDLKKVKGQKYPTHLIRCRGFLWKDFTAEPDTEYTYLVTAYKGTPEEPPDLRNGGDNDFNRAAHPKGKHGIFHLPRSFRQPVMRRTVSEPAAG